MRGEGPSPFPSANPHAPQPSRASPTARGEEGGYSRRVASEPRAQTPLMESGRPSEAITGGIGDAALEPTASRGGGVKAARALEVSSGAEGEGNGAAMETAVGGAQVVFEAKQTWPA